MNENCLILYPRYARIVHRRLFHCNDLRVDQGVTYPPDSHVTGASPTTGTESDGIHASPPQREHRRNPDHRARQTRVSTLCTQSPLLSNPREYIICPDHCSHQTRVSTLYTPITTPVSRSTLCLYTNNTLSIVHSLG